MNKGKVTIEVRGGMVTGLWTSDKGLKTLIRIIDYDVEGLDPNMLSKHEGEDVLTETYQPTYREEN